MRVEMRNPSQKANDRKFPSSCERVKTIINTIAHIINQLFSSSLGDPHPKNFRLIFASMNGEEDYFT